MELGEGTELGPYRLTARLGAGGMGEVFLATDSRLGRSVALKVMSPEVTENPSMRGRFEKEARAIAALSHPNICALFDIGSEGGVSFMVMEYLEGRTLAERVIEGPLPVEEAVPLIDGLCDALAAAHERNIVHRDLKPSNIMITPRGVKVLDFGVAKFDGPTTGGDEATMLQTRPGMLLGTLRYMSPEQASADHITPASDMFSLGVVLFEALTGRHPFPATTNRALLHAILGEPAPAPSSIRPELPPALDALVRHLLEKEPAKRPTAIEVRAALRGLTSDAAAAPVVVRAARNIVGRARELEELASLLVPGGSRMIVVSGEAGLGKSTLVESFLDQVRGRALVGIGRCSERLAGAEAYLPIVEALGSLVTPEYAPVLRRLAPSWHSQVTSGGEAPASMITEAGPDRMKRELTALFDEITRTKPMILFIDDMHWADISTVDLIAYLAPRLEALRLSIVLTYRPADLLLQKHPFLQVKQELQGRGICHEIELRFLGEDDVAAYIDREFPGNRFPAAFADVVYGRTEGSPLFMADLLRYLRNQGLIEERDGRAVLANDLDEVRKELPESVRGMIERKMGRLDEDDLALVRAAAVQGVEFDSVTVAEALKLDPVDVEERLEQLDRVHRLVTATAEVELPDGTPAMRYRFVHVLYQNASFAALGPSRRTALSRTLAESLEARWGRRAAEIAGQLAILFERGRRFEKAAEYFLVAAEHADRLYASQEAVSLARRALEALARADENARAALEPRLLEVLGNGLQRLGAHDEARRAYEEALAKLAADAWQRRASIHRKIGAVWTVQRRYAEGGASFLAAEEALDRIEERGTAWWAQWVQVQLDRAWAFYWQNDVPGIEELVARVRPSVEEKGSALQRTQFTAVQVLGHLRRDRYRVGDETMALSQVHVDHALASGDAYQIGLARFQRGFCHMWRDELDEAETNLRAAAEIAEAIEDRVLQSRCYSYLTVTARKRGDEEATKRWNAKAAEVARAAGMLEYTAVALGNEAWMALRRGESGGAERLGREGLAVLESLPIAHGALDWIVAMPLFAVLVGQERFEEAADIARIVLAPDAHALPEELHAALEAAVRAPGDAGAFTRARELATEHRYV